MAAIITNNFRIHNAEQFYESFNEAATTNYYLFIGRPQPFTTTTGGGTDSAPPTPADNQVSETGHWRDMIAAKRVVAGDVEFVIPRRNWTTGTVYDYYRPDYSASVTSTSGATILSDATCHVVTDDWRVYKCMWNNSGAASTVEPTGTGNTEFSTGDSYVWKYMFTLTTTQVQNHVTTDFIPVTDTLGTISGNSQSTVSSNAVDGEIRRILISTAGAGYTNGTYTDVDISGDGSSGKCTVVISGNTVTSVTITAQGTGYKFADVNVDGISGIGTPSVSAVLLPLVGPRGGHGYDAINELCAFYVMTNTALVSTEGSGDFIVDQDFRRIGLVRNPYNHGTTTVATLATLSALKSVTFAASPTPGTFVVDEVLTGGTSGAKAKVASWDATNRKLYYIQTQYTGIDTNKNITAFATSEVITGTDSSATGTVSALNNPEIDHHSGDVMYVEHRAPITRATDQTENIKLVMEF